MDLTIDRCSDPALWTQVGRDANADRPEYADDAVIWPLYGAPENANDDLSVVAFVDSRPVGRLQRRGETLLEVAVAPGYRRRGVATALMEFAGDDARVRGLRSLRVHLYIDETEPFVLAFFDRLGFTRRAVFSMLADLANPLPPDTLATALRLRDRGFRARVLDVRVAADVSLAAAMQARHFPGAPGYMSEAEMVRQFLGRGGTAMVLEKAGDCAGFILGFVHAATRNGRFVPRQGCGLLASIATSEPYRRMGVASTIMCGFVDLLRDGSSGVRHLLYGGCGPEGDPSRRIAQSVGARSELRHFAFSRSLASGDAP